MFDATMMMQHYVHADIQREDSLSQAQRPTAKEQDLTEKITVMIKAAHGWSTHHFPKAYPYVLAQFFGGLPPPYQEFVAEKTGVDATTLTKYKALAPPHIEIGLLALPLGLQYVVPELVDTIKEMAVAGWLFNNFPMTSFAVLTTERVVNYVRASVFEKPSTFWSSTVTSPFTLPFFAHYIFSNARDRFTNRNSYEGQMSPVRDDH